MQHQVLLFEKTAARIGAHLKAEFPELGWLTWHADGHYSCDGSKVNDSEINPTIGWLNFDIFAAKLMPDYCATLQNSRSIQWLQTINAGLDHPLYGQLSASGIRISKSSAQALPIAEYTLAYALHFFQNIASRLQNQHHKQWKMARFSEIANTRWLIIGFGHIGQHIAQRARAFDAQIVAVRQSDKQDPLADKTITLANLPTELPLADVVVLACPHTEETHNLANEQFFNQMKKDALLVNIARGALLDENALLAGLQHNQPAQAVLDVFNTEPLPAQSALWSHPQVVVTAHTSNAGNGTRKRADAQFMHNLRRFIDNNNPTDEVYFPAAD